jgi:hypothetical protein
MTLPIAAPVVTVATFATFATSAPYTSHALHRTTRRGLLLSVALPALTLATLSPLAACASDISDMTVAPPAVRMHVVDRDTGQMLALYQHEGRSYVAGRPGARYAIRLANQTGRRVLVVVSVDGVNVVSGETAHWNQTGYVLDAYASYDVAGWRKSDSTAAAFEFAALRDSYAARTGRPGNVGVIGMAVFFERPAPRPAKVHSLPMAPEMETHDSAAGSARGPDSADASEAGAPGRIDRRREAAAAPAAPAPVPAPANAHTHARASQATQPAPMAKLSAERLGTGHGRRETSEVRRTAFERMAHTPQMQIEVLYDSFHNLVAAGVIPPHTAGLHVPPRAFPALDDNRGYVQDPPSRR